MTALLVCPLSRLPETIRASGPRDVLTLMMPGGDVPKQADLDVGRHEVVSFSDITEPRDGYVLATPYHMRQILDFVASWNRDKPLLIHCFAGISRSPAAAFIAACALMPGRDERELAIKLRNLSPSATPNIHMVRLADDILSRQGRMVSAINAIGRGAEAYEGEYFQWDMIIQPGIIFSKSG